MMKNFAKRVMKKAGLIKPDAVMKEQNILSRKGMIAAMETRPYFGDKIEYYNQYTFSPGTGWQRASLSPVPEKGNGNWPELAYPKPAAASPVPIKVHYGCGPHILPGWVNVDLFEHGREGCLRVDLLERHPFADNSVAFGFSQDMLEHFTQGESLFFLAEACRTLRKGGVLRLSFPSLEGVLKRHYSPATETRVNQGEFEAYHFWDHKHFYSRETFKRVAEHLGYTKVTFKDFGESAHQELCGLDRRPDQQDLNIYVELEK